MSINIVHILIVWFVVFIIFEVSIVSSWASTWWRINIDLFLLRFLQASFLILLLRGALGGVLTVVVVQVFYREAAVFPYSLKVTWFYQARNRRNVVGATARGAERGQATIENPASSYGRQVAIAAALGPARFHCRWFRAELWRYVLASRASTPSFCVNVQRCPCIQIYSLIHRMALHLTLALCIWLLGWESPQLISLLRCKFAL